MLAITALFGPAVRGAYSTRGGVHACVRVCVCVCVCARATMRACHRTPYGACSIAIARKHVNECIQLSVTWVWRVVMMQREA